MKFEVLLASAYLQKATLISSWLGLYAWVGAWVREGCRKKSVKSLVFKEPDAIVT